MPARILKKASALSIRGPIQHWLIHLRISTQPEPHNFLQSSGLTRNKSRFTIIHITRNLLECLMVGYRNFVKIAGKLNSMILLSNASAVYSELQRMREIVHESHEYFSEYMRLHIPREILSRLELEVQSVQIAMASIGNTSDYIDTRNRMIFTEDASQALKAHRIAVKGVQNLFEDMLTEACRVILSFIENSVSVLLNRTIMREINRHLSKISHSDVVSRCLRKANAIPLFLKNQEDVFYEGLYHLCRTEITCCIILSRRAEELCLVAQQTLNESVLWHTIEILNLIVSRAAKSLNSVKPSLTSTGITNSDLQFDHSLYAKLPSIATTATLVLNRQATANVTSIYHSTLRVISGIWRISTRLGKSSHKTNEILSHSVNFLVAKLNGCENKDSKTRHLTMMVLAMLAKSSYSREKLQNKLVITRLIEILDETHQRYVKARENKEGQTFASGCIVDCETARSNSCESLVKNSPLSFTCNKQLSFASDCTLMKTGSKLCDLTPWRNSKGSLPNLSSSTLNVKFSISNGTLNDDTLDIDYSAKFIQHILHNCAIALKRICADEDSRGHFHEHGGMDVVTKILSSQYSNEAVIPYLKELWVMQDRYQLEIENGNTDSRDHDFRSNTTTPSVESEGNQSSPSAVHKQTLEINGNVPQLITKELTEMSQKCTIEVPAHTNGHSHTNGSLLPSDVANFPEKNDTESTNEETKNTDIDLTTSCTNESRLNNEVDITDVSNYVSSAELANIMKTQRTVLPAKVGNDIKNLKKHVISIADSFHQDKSHDLFVSDDITDNLAQDKLRFLSPGFEYVVGNNIFINTDSDRSRFNENFCSESVTKRNCTTYVIKTTTSS